MAPNLNPWDFLDNTLRWWSVTLVPRNSSSKRTKHEIRTLQWSITNAIYISSRVMLFSKVSIHDEFSSDFSFGLRSELKIKNRRICFVYFNLIFRYFDYVRWSLSGSLTWLFFLLFLSSLILSILFFLTRIFQLLATTWILE